MKQPELGRKIAETRIAKGFTQEELTQQCNLNVRTLQRIESGDVIPRLFTLKKLSEILETSLDTTSSVESEQNQENIELEVDSVRHQFKELFNLKQNMMKKLLIIAIFVLSASILVSVVIKKMNNNSSLKKELLGTWKIIEGNNSEGRIVLFTDDQNFESRTEHALYNCGVYSTPNDTLLVTIHQSYPGSQLSPTSNYYRCIIKSDTLKLEGFYMQPTNEGLYQKAWVSEIWVRQ